MAPHHKDKMIGEKQIAYSNESKERMMRTLCLLLLLVVPGTAMGEEFKHEHFRLDCIKEKNGEAYCLDNTDFDKMPECSALATQQWLDHIFKHTEEQRASLPVEMCKMIVSEGPFTCSRKEGCYLYRSHHYLAKSIPIF